MRQAPLAIIPKASSPLLKGSFLSSIYARRGPFANNEKARAFCTVRRFQCPNAGSCHWQSLTPIRDVHTKISVWCPAGSIGLSSNDSAPDPVGTTFLLLGGFKSSVQLPTACKPEAATLSGCVRGICFSPLESHSRSLHITLVASQLPNWGGYESATGAIAMNPRDLPQRDFGHSHHSGSESGTKFD